MREDARVGAAIEILDRILSGDPAEKALTNWARASRFAGSGDRRAVRDLVFDALRRRRSLAALGGAETGRGLMLGHARAAARPLADLFTGAPHAPSPPGPEDGPPGEAPTDAVRLDVPDWVLDLVRADHGAAAEAILAALQHRAPVFLRANLARIDREAAATALAGAGIATRPHPLAPTALEVLDGAPRIAGSEPYRDGRVELQDAASQAAVALVAHRQGGRLDGARVLDFCAGGGGKALALAALGARVTAHDADPRRMADLPARAARAGTPVDILPPGASPDGLPPFDVVLADAPCSGSGAWRRQVEARWRLTPERLDALVALQESILDLAAPRVRPGGTLAYATCSIFARENGGQTRAFLARHSGWTLDAERQFLPAEGGDGFYAALLRRDDDAAPLSAR